MKIKIDATGVTDKETAIRFSVWETQPGEGGKPAVVCIGEANVSFAPKTKNKDIVKALRAAAKEIKKKSVEAAGKRTALQELVDAPEEP